MGRETKPASDLQKDPAPGLGVRSLMQGNRASMADKPETSANRVIIPVWYYFGVDLVLLAVTVGVAWPNPAALGWKAQLLCIALVALGAVAGIVGVLKRMPED